MAGDERPAKRVKLGDRDAESEAFAQGEFASGMPAYGGFAEAAPQDWNTSMPGVFDPGWKWEAASSAPNVPGLLLPLIPTDGQWRSSQMPTMGPYPEQSFATLAPGVLPFDASPMPSQQLPVQQASRLIPPARRKIAPAADVPSQVHHHRRKSRSKPFLVSPFKDCLETFGNLAGPRYSRPIDGKVNGYIKFNWPQGGPPQGARSVIDITDEETSKTPKGQSSAESYYRHSSASSDASSSSGHVILSPPPTTSATTCISTKSLRNFTTSPIQISDPSLAISPVGSFSSSHLPSSAANWQATALFHGGMTEAPRMVPPHFGHSVTMDHIDRKFWGFYVQNWCPGRSVLKGTNLWLTDFAKMQNRAGILAAIQSLAGIYIYDYQPAEIVRRRVNQHFAEAESRLSHLLANASSLNNQDATELITLASILSMQDIVLIERRLRRPYNPRWLQGFKQSEHFLQKTDPGNRFWKSENVQLDSLRISQAVIVGRAVILAQPMMPLPSPATFDFAAEAGRFGWLLYGTPMEMYEIHGGCGFSKRLLHLFSQVTCCAARLNQDPGSVIVPRTAEYLLTELLDLRQWSSESTPWEDAKDKPPPSSWVRSMPDNYVIQTPEEMTDITAEAWRLAGLVYLQCRLMRLPRNDPAVLCHLSDLARCISIMPTSGYVFTAQAPLLPVFFLGLLATVPDHKQVAIAWFEQVIYTPVRSSVPPLYEALNRILSWLPKEMGLPLSTNKELPSAIADRQPWWEQMVSKVQEREPEVLCLT